MEFFSELSPYCELHSHQSEGQAGIITLHLNISDQPHSVSRWSAPITIMTVERRILTENNYSDLFSKMIDIVTMLVNKFFRSCFLSDLFRAARDFADVLHVTRAQPRLV